MDWFSLSSDDQEQLPSASAILPPHFHVANYVGFFPLLSRQLPFLSAVFQPIHSDCLVLGAPIGGSRNRTLLRSMPVYIEFLSPSLLCSISARIAFETYQTTKISVVKLFSSLPPQRPFSHLDCPATGLVVGLCLPQVLNSFPTAVMDPAFDFRSSPPQNWFSTTTTPKLSLFFSSLCSFVPAPGVQFP